MSDVPTPTVIGQITVLAEAEVTKASDSDQMVGEEAES